MTVWYIFDNCPREFGEPEIKGDKCYPSKALAEHMMKNMRAKAPYENQYLEVRKMKMVAT